MTKIEAGRQGGKESSSNSQGPGNERVVRGVETPEGERKIMDSEGPRQSDQGFHTCETDKERTWCSFKGPGYDHRKI